MKRIVFLIVFVLALASRTSVALDPEWTTPLPPFKIAGNIYYVGSEDLASYLITTPKGNILINSNLESSPAQIRKSVEDLGFKFSDIKILLNSQGHFDHTAGSADVIKQTGAKFEVMDGDVSVIESGGQTDFYLGKDKQYWFPQTKVGRVLHDGDKIVLGGTVLTARKTAGHTMGTTTFTMNVHEGGKLLHVVIVGGSGALDGYRVAGQKSYPGIDEDFRRQFEILQALPCDVFLGAHGSYFGLKEKYARWKAGDAKAFIDPAGYRAYVERNKRAFETRLQQQSAAGQ